MKKRLLVIVLACIMFAACSRQDLTESSSTSEDNQIQISEDGMSATRDFFAMDTYMTVTAYGDNAEQAVDESVDFVITIENLISTNIDTSEVAVLNKSGENTVSEDTAYLIERSLELNISTNEAFDITIYPIVKAWGFTTGEYQVPKQEQITELLQKVGSDQLQFNIDDNSVTFQQVGMEIDLGGIAKGYASTKIMDIFRQYGITSGIVNLGGNVQVYGTKSNGKEWNVAVQYPKSTTDYLGVLKVADKAVITSGGYERYFEKDGKIYWHIMDPSTGYPADSGLVSVTIISSDGTYADVLSTALFVMGKEKAIEYWGEHKEEFDMVLLDEEDKLIMTGGIADDFSTDLECQIIE